MSVEGQVLGASTVAGGTAAALVNTGNPALVGVVVGLVMIVVLGFVTRAVMKRN